MGKDSHGISRFLILLLRSRNSPGMEESTTLFDFGDLLPVLLFSQMLTSSSSFFSFEPIIVFHSYFFLFFYTRLFCV